MGISINPIVINTRFFSFFILFCLFSLLKITLFKPNWMQFGICFVSFNLNTGPNKEFNELAQWFV